ncbi:MAG: hypothetical protein IK122_02790, partial [Alphaproteobacteria bacterium]|nr:hypothetical protein [Alphaproteobacteria bacterium]
MYMLIIKTIQFFVVCFLTFSVHAQTIDDLRNNPDFRTTEEVLNQIHEEKPTDCASKIFSDALRTHSNEIDESEPEYKVRAWAHETMTGNADVLTALLDCPEIKNTADETTIIFSPIEYRFPGGRTLTINYSTQPKVLKQKLLLATKRSLPNGNANPKLMDPNDPAKYLNTEPAWYAIMVVQHDSLKDFVGPDKNNTLSVKYINDHIDEIYPKGYTCTSKSTLANDKYTINQVVKEVVDIEDDSNDYYVAGDVNLEWIMYAEIAAEVILTVVTMGGGEYAMIQLKSMRAFKNGKKLIKSMAELSKIKEVGQYIDNIRKVAQHSDDIAKLEKEIKTLKSAEEIAAKRAEIKKLQESIKTLEKEADTLVKTSKDVKAYKEQAATLDDLHKYYKSLRAFKRPQTGNIITKNLKKVGAYAKTIKASQSGAKTMAKAGKLARAGMSSRSAKIGDWLFDATLKHGARIARFERDAGILYGFLSFVGDMYDKTSTTSKEFSNGIEFKPLCLLSADDLAGQENVVNYGMWLMWVGNSTDPADDDAAYLQAMDFTSKFSYQLDEYQDEHGANCNVDIYVVRPIIRLDETNADEPSGEMFYLFMNEIPWSTS